MASTLSTLGRNVVLDAVGATYGFVSAHTGDPGPTGTTNEVVGGSPAYARKAVTWAAAVGGTLGIVAPFPVFDIPAGTTLAYIGFWTLAVGGTYGGCWDIVPETYAGQGTYTLDSGTVSI